MTMAGTANGIAQIGEVAGIVWQLLSERGPMTATKIIREVDAPRDVTLLALGWLAREDKLHIEDNARSRVFSLR
jgi:hypothetical protein